MSTRKTKLTLQQRRFADEYLQVPHITRAAVAAGYSEKCAPEIGSKLLRRVQVREYIERQEAKLARKRSTATQSAIQNGELLPSGHVPKKHAQKNQEPEKPEQKMIYVMLDERTNYYKIGSSRNPTFREKTLQSDNPLIVLMFAYPAPISVERNLQKRFTDKRIRGEWFALTGADLKEIETALSGKSVHP